MMLSRIAWRAAGARSTVSSIATTTTVLPAILATTSSYNHARWAPHRTYARKSRPTPQEFQSASPASPSNSLLPNESVPEEQAPKFDPRTLLDQGIPPTPEHYNPSASARPHKVPPQPSTARGESLDILPKGTSGSGGGGSKPNGPRYVSTTDKRRETLANLMYLAFFGASISGAVYLGRNWESEEEERAHKDVPNGWGLMLFYDRLRTRLNDILDHYNLPNGEKLLPDHIPSTFRPYTLVISVEDLLVHSEWTREHGWRTAKRPGVDYFLTYLGQYFEIVIFTTQQNSLAGPMVAKLDPFHTCHQLYREATKYKNGMYIKDLNYLNRDVSKVIMIDTKPSAWHDQPDNAIKMKPWHGDPRDKELVALIPFLEYIATMGLTDVREVIKSFPEGSSIPLEFAKREAAAREAFEKQLEEERKKKKKVGGGDFLASLLGLKTPQQKEEKMIQDQVRERGQQTYELIMKDLKDNGDEYREADRRAQEELMSGMKTSLNKIFTEGVPQPQIPQQQQQQLDPTAKK